MKKTLLTIFACIFFSAVGQVHAATWIVTNTSDISNGVCDSDCSLREAIEQVNLNAPGAPADTIVFSPLFDNPQDIIAAPIAINRSVNIIGKGNKNVRLHPDTLIPFPDSIFEITGGSGTYSVVVKLTNIGFFDGPSAKANGGSHLNVGDFAIVEINNCLFQDGFAGNAGSIRMIASEVNIRNSTFSNNLTTLTFAGGAISQENGILSVQGTTFKGNSAQDGSAIFVTSGTADIINSTFSGNLPPPSGFENSYVLSTFDGTLALTNVTVTDNRVRGSGATIGKPNGGSGQIFLKNSIVAKTISVPPAFGENVLGALGVDVRSATTQGNNIVGFTDFNDPQFPLPPNNTTPNVNGDFVGTSNNPFDPRLRPLAFNGGPTETHEPMAMSFAIDRGNATGSPTIDQRGATRPQGMGIDIGAFETGVSPTSGNTPTGSNVTTTVGAVTVTFPGVLNGGTTTQIPISPSGTPPSGFSFGTGFPAFEISTTAVYTTPITICMQVPGTVPLGIFNTLNILHFENGAWTPLSPTTRDSMTYIICSTTNSLSPFAFAQQLAPTAANVSISGRVLTPGERGLSNAIVTLTDSFGTTRSVRSNNFGYFFLNEIAAGQTVIVSVSSKGYQFQPQVVSVKEDLTNLIFVGSGGENFTRFK